MVQHNDTSSALTYIAAAPVARASKTAPNRFLAPVRKPLSLWERVDAA